MCKDRAAASFRLTYGCVLISETMNGFISCVGCMGEVLPNADAHRVTRVRARAHSRAFVGLHRGSGSRRRVIHPYRHDPATSWKTPLPANLPAIQ